MDYDQYYRLRRGNVKAFRELYSMELRRMWFVCYHITQDVSKAAPLLLSGWKKAMERVVVKSPDVPKDSFTTLTSTEIFKMASQGIESDEDYESLPIPSLPFPQNMPLLSKGSSNWLMRNGISICLPHLED